MLKKIKNILMLGLLSGFVSVGLTSVVTTNSSAASFDCSTDCGCNNGSLTCCIAPSGAICLDHSC